MLNKTNNVYKIVINGKEFKTKYFKNQESKDNLEVYVEGENFSFLGLKEFRLFINYLTDVCESLEEEEV